VEWEATVVVAIAVASFASWKASKPKKSVAAMAACSNWAPVDGERLLEAS